jgi:hypothetical protein
MEKETTPKTDEQIKKEFNDKYIELVKETNCQLVAYPKFVQRDDGSFSVVVAYDILITKI